MLWLAGMSYIYLSAFGYSLEWHVEDHELHVSVVGRVL